MNECTELQIRIQIQIQIRDLVEGAQTCKAAPAHLSRLSRYHLQVRQCPALSSCWLLSLFSIMMYRKVCDRRRSSINSQIPKANLLVTRVDRTWQCPNAPEYFSCFIRLWYENGISHSDLKWERTSTFQSLVPLVRLRRWPTSESCLHMSSSSSLSQCRSQCRPPRTITRCIVQNCHSNS